MSAIDREEQIEQAYFFRAFRERLNDGLPAQDLLARLGEELLSSTKLPMAVNFLAAEIRLGGVIGPAMARINHYFTPFQAHVIGQAELDVSRFPFDQALLILEKEAESKIGGVGPAGLFVYQFEALSRNRLGYTDGLAAMAGDPMYSEDWSDYIHEVRARLAEIDFADLIYLRSETAVADRRRRDPDYQARRPVLFGNKEGRIARANRGRDPVYLFQALQRQLGYPEVPRPKRPDGSAARLIELEQRVLVLESRLRNVESATAGAGTAGGRPSELDIDLEALRVRPEETAGVPSGWGKASP